MLSSWTLDNTEYFGPNFGPGEEEIHVLVELLPYGVRRSPLRIDIGQKYVDDLRPYQVAAERLGDHVDVRKRH
uniref:Uncharacterized protein n=1 Tax=Globisporangium ultimum (strain ATCC 200006 / CBS 805.95 / DAOM BR144) TaxID=431595 RepID=K3WI02_GLOUD